MPVNDCFFDNFLAGATFVATTTSTSPAPDIDCECADQVVTVLARLPEQQCNNVELFELFSETTQGEAFFYVGALCAADLDATSTDHGERAGPQVNWFRPGSRPALEHPVRCAFRKTMPERHSACRHSRGVRIAVRSLESRFLQSRHNLSWSMSTRSPTPCGTPLELALEVLPCKYIFVFTRLLLHASSWLRGADDSS